MRVKKREKDLIERKELEERALQQKRKDEQRKQEEKEQELKRQEEKRQEEKQKQIEREEEEERKMMEAFAEVTWNPLEEMALKSSAGSAELEYIVKLKGLDVVNVRRKQLKLKKLQQVAGGGLKELA